MFERFYPDEYMDSAYDIPYEKLYEEGYRGIVFDIDNTLVPHGAASDERSRELFRRLHQIGFTICLLSNNDEERVKRFLDSGIDALSICDADKPSAKNYEAAMDLMHTDRSNTISIGDQIFTDVWGANRAGIRNIMVKFISPKEEIQIVLKRRLERIVLHFYFRSRKQKQA